MSDAEKIAKMRVKLARLTAKQDEIGTKIAKLKGQIGEAEAKAAKPAAG